MKKFFKITGIILGIVLLLALGFLLFIQVRGIPTYTAENYELQVDMSPERVANGERIASMMCVHCHTGTDNKLSGNFLPDIPAEFGEIYSKNITQDKEVGVGNWTDGQLYYFLRTGVKPDGKYAPPYMPKYPLMADDDLQDLIAWLRSDRPAVQASKAEAIEAKPSFLVKFLCNVAFKPLPMPEKPIVKPDTNDLVATGKYVFNGMMVCYACHSKDFKTNNELNPELSDGFAAGGNKLLNLKREVVPSTNLTFDESGIANYTEDDFIQAVKYGRKKDGTQLRYPMMPHSQLSDLEVRSIYAYLKTVPKIKSAAADSK